jgi:uncharacterized protein (DUF2147 family)
MKILVSTLLATFFIHNAFAQNNDPVVGNWKTIDDKTNTVKSILQLEIVNNQLQGTILKTFTKPGDKELKVCEACKDYRKDKPIIGMVIMTGLKNDAPGVWSGGQILDPKEGDIYKVKLAISEDGKKLDVRGYVGVPLLGRTQVWIKE